MGVPVLLVLATPLTTTHTVATEWELFWTLTSGAALIICEPEAHKDVHYLHALMTEYQVSSAFFSPSMLNIFMEMLVAEGQEGQTHVPCLRDVVVVGEALLPEVCHCAEHEDVRLQCYRASLSQETK